MKTQRFLIATEGTFDGRTITAEEIQSILMNFKAGRLQVDVGYEFYSWTPNLGEVVAMSVNYKASKMCLYAEVTVTPALQEIAASPVDHYLVPAIHTVLGETTASVLVAVGVTQNPIIPDLDRLQFKVPNHQHLPFCEPVVREVENIETMDDFKSRYTKSTATIKGLLFRRVFDSAEKQPVFYLEALQIEPLIFRRVYPDNSRESGDPKSIVSPAPRSGHEIHPL